MRNESKLKQKQKPKQKHIFIRVDKVIEAGDLVRCVEERGGHPIGQVRKVSGTDGNQFYIRGCALFHDGEFWEPVHKLKVGDLVELHKNGKPMKVTAVYPEDNRFCTPGMMLAWYATDDFRLYQKPKTEADINMFPIEPIKAYDDFSELAVTRDGIYVGTLSSTIVPDRKAEMQKAVAEMVVELMDQETAISIGAYPDIGLTMVEVLWCGQSIGEAELAPNDTWDTLTGLYVALSKATGRDLPDWVYGKEAKK